MWPNAEGSVELLNVGECLRLHRDLHCCAHPRRSPLAGSRTGTPLFNLCSCIWWTQCPTHPPTSPAPQQILVSMPRAWDGNVSTPGMAYMALSVQATFTAPMVRKHATGPGRERARRIFLGLEIFCHASPDPFHICGRNLKSADAPSSTYNQLVQ